MLPCSLTAFSFYSVWFFHFRLFMGQFRTHFCSFLENSSIYSTTTLTRARRARARCHGSLLFLYIVNLNGWDNIITGYMYLYVFLWFFLFSCCAVVELDSIQNYVHLEIAIFIIWLWNGTIYTRTWPICLMLANIISCFLILHYLPCWLLYSISKLYFLLKVYSSYSLYFPL